MNRLGELKGYIRDINLNMISNEYDIKLDVSKRYNTRLRFRMPSRKLIKYVTKIGGVLTGSRALRCYSINGKQMLDRKSSDWDFIITQDMAFKICDKFDISGVYSDGDVITIRNQRWHVHPAYSDSYRVGPVDVHLMVRSEMPEYNEKRGVRIAAFNYTMNEKVKMIDDILNKPPVLSTSGGNATYGYSGVTRNVSMEEANKHLDDLNRLIIKFNCIDGKDV